MGTNYKDETISIEFINKAFKDTNFGTAKPIDIIKWSLLKVASGYSTGHTVQIIMQDLGLIIKARQPKLTKHGQHNLWELFKEGYRHE